MSFGVIYGNRFMYDVGFSKKPFSSEVNGFSFKIVIIIRYIHKKKKTIDMYIGTKNKMVLFFFRNCKENQFPYDCDYLFYRYTYIIHI